MGSSPRTSTTGNFKPHKNVQSLLGAFVSQSTEMRVRYPRARGEEEIDDELSCEVARIRLSLQRGSSSR